MSFFDLFRKKQKYTRKELTMRITEKGPVYFDITGKEVPINELSNDALRELAGMCERWKKNPASFNQTANHSGTLRSQLERAGCSFEYTSYLGNDFGSISNSSNSLFNQLFEEDGFVLGFIPASDQDYNDDIFKNGFQISSSGESKKYPELLKDTVYLFLDYGELVKQIKYSGVVSHGVKGNSGSFLVRLPVNDLLSNANLFVRGVNSRLYLDPRYIVGFVPVSNNSIQDVTINSNSDYSRTHQYSFGGSSVNLSGGFPPDSGYYRR